ncbi:hypothetical protein X772_36535 [Mesorhizobium sp. LSJC280B00]|nr:hypothetical protein X772_36535 [Mesorhizobium sp. LSJC280B00]
MYLTLDPVRLVRDIRLAQERLVDIADTPTVRLPPTARHCRSKTFCPGCGLRGVVGK